jgi:hypothetical protein
MVDWKGLMHADHNFFAAGRSDDDQARVIATFSRRRSLRNPIVGVVLASLEGIHERDFDVGSRPPQPGTASGRTTGRRTA